MSEHKTSMSNLEPRADVPMLPARWWGEEVGLTLKGLLDSTDHELPQEGVLSGVAGEVCPQFPFYWECRGSISRLYWTFK